MLLIVKGTTGPARGRTYCKLPPGEIVTSDGPGQFALESKQRVLTTVSELRKVTTSLRTNPWGKKMWSVVEISAKISVASKRIFVFVVIAELTVNGTVGPARSTV